MRASIAACAAPFERLDDYITQDELRALSENYKRIAGFSLADVA